jgi:1-acyl-sn-glycerol-3-phosphate acyltransferase
MTNLLYSVLRYWVQWYFYTKYKIKVYDREKLPRNYTGGYIIACNHQSYSDPPAIAAVVKGRFAFMAKDELFRKSPLFALIIRIAGAFPVVRGAGDNSVIERSVEYLRKGRILVIFPEGTRSEDGTIGRAKSGVSLIAATAAVPVLPVCIMYGLGGRRRSIDMAIGDMIPREELAISPEAGRGELKRISARILDSIKALQAQILSERGISEFRREARNE